MKKISTPHSAVRFSAIVCFATIAASAFLINACSKVNKQNTTQVQNTAAVANNRPAPVVQDHTLSQAVTVADLRKSDDGSYTIVRFRENAEVFTLRDVPMISQLQDAFSSQKAVKISYNPWSATVLSVSAATDAESAAIVSRQVNTERGVGMRIDMANTDPNVINDAPGIAILNSTTVGLNDVVPDMATAQMMFDYITHQCCQLAGPYQIDHCIPFQYCPDGCYARAHKMCWIINNVYHYQTHKIFSFAFGGSASLSVKAEKWGGCCINWWYHVAPLVSIKTSAGIKAYVFDPAMFDQPVLLATWLHWQQNPACSGHALVTSINIQPTSSYSPIDTAHFDTDPTYSSTNSTLISYASLKSCP